MSRRVLFRSGLLAACLLGGAPALASTETPSASMTVRPATGNAPATMSAQSGIAGPLQGPLASPSASGGACCPCRTVVHHVRHRVRVVHRVAPVTVASAPVLVPYVPLVPYRPVYVYRPVVPVYAYRPYYYRPFFGPRFY